MKRLVDEFALGYPGFQKVEHVYFYAVHGADDATRQVYLRRAYLLGKEFAEGVEPAAATGSAADDRADVLTKGGWTWPASGGSTVRSDS